MAPGSAWSGNTKKAGDGAGLPPAVAPARWVMVVDGRPRATIARRGLPRAIRPTVSPANAERPPSDAELSRRADGRTYTITELAHEFDITPRAIRFYEDMGLLFPARQGRSRIYSQRDRTRLKLTLRGKRLGFSLQEIRQLVTMYDTENDTVPQLEAFLASLAAHREALTQQLEDIRVTLEEIGLHEDRCRQLLVQARARRGRS